MTKPADDSMEIKRWAFRMKPQAEPTGDHWKAFYPGSDWSVSAPSKKEALQQLEAEVRRRRDAGDDPFAFSEVVYRQHLRDPIPGVYAMDNELYRQLLREVGYDQNAMQQVFEESERRRAQGQSYTKADYLASTNRKTDQRD
jgi:hypothetical protein